MSGYNGFTNWETWLLNVWLTNDPELHDATYEMVAEAEHDAYPLTFVADELRENVLLQWDDMVEQSTRSGWAPFFTDMMHDALQSIDWRQLAEHFIETWSNMETDRMMWVHEMTTE